MDVIKSSRFWLALIIIGGAMAMGILGKITGNEAIATCVGILAGFGVAKTNVSMHPKGRPPTAIVGILFLMLVGLECGSNLQTNLSRAHEATKIATTLGEASFHATCKQIAQDCGEIKDRECTKWQSCDRNRGVFLGAMEGIQYNLKVANDMAITLEEKK